MCNNTIKASPCLVLGFVDLEIKSDYICHQFHKNIQKVSTKLWQIEFCFNENSSQQTAVF
jgi:hypothetical protein